MNIGNPKFAANHHSLEEQFSSDNQIVDAIMLFIDCLRHVERRLHLEKPSILLNRNEFSVRNFIHGVPVEKSVATLPTKYQQLWYLYTRNTSKVSDELWDAKLSISERMYAFPKDHRERIFISLMRHKVFSKEHVEFKEESASKEDHLQNAVTTAHLVAHLPKYEPHNAKHHQNSQGDASKMELSDEIAQGVLNYSVPYGKKRYGCYLGSIYEFQSHRPEVRLFHGYLLEHPETKLGTAEIKFILSNCDYAHRI